MKITIRPAIKLPQIIIHRKVAAYCRVSTQQEIQHHSPEAQREYYEKRITGNPDWEFAGIYADEASRRYASDRPAKPALSESQREP